MLFVSNINQPGIMHGVLCDVIWDIELWPQPIRGGRKAARQAAAPEVTLRNSNKLSASINTAGVLHDGNRFERKRSPARTTLTDYSL